MGRSGKHLDGRTAISLFRSGIELRSKNGEMDGEEGDDSKMHHLLGNLFLEEGRLREAHAAYARGSPDVGCEKERDLCLIQMAERGDIVDGEEILKRFVRQGHEGALLVLCRLFFGQKTTTVTRDFLIFYLSVESSMPTMRHS